LECIPTAAGCGAGALYLSSISFDVNEAGVFVGQQALPLPDGGYRFEAYRGQLDAQGNFDLDGLGLYQGEFNTAALAVDDLDRIAGFATLNAAAAEQQALLWLADTPGTRAVILRPRSHDAIFAHDFGGD
jgi:hypothetical protein